MAIPLLSAPQPFAVRGDTDGVPLDNLSDVVGAKTTIRLGETAFGDIDQVAVALRVEGFEVQRHRYDGVIVYVQDEQADSDPVLLERWSIRIEQWAQLTRSRNGAVLVSGSTGIPVTGELTGGTALIGRSTGNKVLFQTVGWTNNADDMVLYANVFTFRDGVLARRLEPLEDHATRQVIVHRSSPTKPAVPSPGEVMFNGQVPVFSDTTEWKHLETSLTGATDPEWLASAEFVYNFNVGIWTVASNAWHVYPGGTTFRVQYASAANGPWVATAPDTDTLWVRYRLDDGTWSVHQVRGAETATNWRTILDVTLNNAQTTSEFRFTQIDTDEFQDVVVVYQGDRDAATAGLQGQQIPVAIPAFMVLSGDPTITDQQATSILAHFVEVNGSSFTVGGAIPDLSAWMNEADATEQRLRLDFYGSIFNDPFVSRLVVRRGYTVNDARLRVLVR